MNFDYILFDLDGTLIDTSEGITKSVQYALNKRGYVGHSLQSLQSFIGPPLREQFMNFTGADLDEGTRLVATYREYYTETGIFECRPYDGIEAMLRRLVRKEKKLLVATSKPEVFARRILEHFSLDGYFTFIGGAELDNTRTDKVSVIRYVLDCAGGIDTLSSRAVMVGDTHFDIEGAKLAGICSIGVTYGFGDAMRIREAGPLCLCSSVRELDKVLA